MSAPHGTRIARTRRLLAGSVAAAALALAAGSAAIPSLAAAPTRASASAPALTSTMTKKVAAAGTYTVIVTIPPPAAAQTVSVFVGSSVARNIAVSPGQNAVLAFYAHFTSRHFKVRVVASGAPVKFTVAAARQLAQSTPPTGATGATGANGITIVAPPSGPYKHLAWSDEFNGPAATPPNASNWTADSAGSCGDGTLSTDTQDPANASLNGSGDLGINAYENATSAGTPTYTSAQLDTNNKVSFSYGELEARIALPRGSGLCSGFWMVGNSPNGGCFPQCGEIDVMEAVTLFPNTVFGTLHGPIMGVANDQQWQQGVTSPTPFPGTFHTYGLIWQPGRLTWTLDGVPYGTATPKQLPPSAQWVFDGNPFHILLSLAVGGWPGPPAAGASFPATMRVDWVRLYD
ncbi:MAG TPA: glycoside hydrolase family 16 protein [Solirubrobacteraceae bacterium]|nr:glycoside hydrolase family 16 protein [Solirubrobacteraceae bacterium]